MSNTLARILSAIVMAIIVCLAVLGGKWSTLAVIWLAGLLCIDEVLINFIKLSRRNFIYLYSAIFFSGIFWTTNYYMAQLSLVLFTVFSIMMNLFLIHYLFNVPLENSMMKNVAKRKPALLTALVMLPIFSIGIHFFDESWKQILAILLIVTYTMDTGAWFVGKNFGKTKLWPTVSPKKTVEGLVGGVIISGALASVAWWYFFGEYRWYYSIIFGLCGVISQVGDLIQSKLKREFSIKDSSNLIPGHGGIYDRIDSLIFLSPFFVIVVKYLRY